jgi:hypothetical protein
MLQWSKHILKFLLLSHASFMCSADQSNTTSNLLAPFSDIIYYYSIKRADHKVRFPKCWDYRERF